MKACHACGEPREEKEQPGFRETCLRCDATLHCCANCRFYDAHAHEWCREPLARPHKPRDPESANTCDCFLFRDGQADGKDRENAARAGLAALFGETPEDAPDETPSWQQAEPEEKRDPFAE